MTLDTAMDMAMDTTIKAPASMQWKEAKNGVKVTTPGLAVAGYAMHFAYIPERKRLRLAGSKATIVNLLHGSLARPNLGEKQCARIQQNRDIVAERDSLIYICVDETAAEMRGDEMKAPITGLLLQWVEPASGCYRTDPKLEVGAYRVNLWYLIPNKNGGIHNHATIQHHNIADQFVEFHTQLRGKGWMVKYKEQDEKTAYERVALGPGQTHPVWATIEERKGKKIVTYPWHAYVASETGALFIAFEEMVCQQ
jgi:hypothetical protein